MTSPRFRLTSRGRRGVAIAMTVVAATALVLRPAGPGEPVLIDIPTGATSTQIASLLQDNGIVGSARLFHAYIRLRGADRSLKAGTYALETGGSMSDALRRLTRGEVETVAVTVPEGFQIIDMAGRLSEITGLDSASVVAYLRSDSLADELGLPGPTAEGYLFPDTYRFARGVPIQLVARTMAQRYRAVWTAERLARLEQTGMTEREVVTLASIVQAEARQVSEMPRIAGVYHNRLRDGWLLQADPTVLYALGGYRARLLYAAIDSVEDNPYNTYATRGLPPGPIASPGERAIDATLSPEEHGYMFFVAQADGFHSFSRTLGEHNSAKEGARLTRTGSGR
jgi:UPF0755 protein